ncbi:Protein BTG1 [Fukomys damarensis]|uniref:Protein BTG1 n=1 Tax=Fukomys damarensis TaxID=885580 RepID=A0A091CZJ1_FUKDA|nr:Protein BTG1 [Fukomys damarensis]
MGYTGGREEAGPTVRKRLQGERKRRGRVQTGSPGGRSARCPHASLLHPETSTLQDRPTALSFISNLRLAGLTSEQQLQTFSQRPLAEHCKHHWFPEKPRKRSGYRCVLISPKMDPLLGPAAQRTGLGSRELSRLLPCELTL